MSSTEAATTAALMRRRDPPGSHMCVCVCGVQVVCACAPPATHLARCSLCSQTPNIVLIVTRNI